MLCYVIFGSIRLSSAVNNSFVVATMNTMPEL